ncbi:MAG: TIGR02679 family protein [Burkholderiaceae bacterium]
MDGRSEVDIDPRLDRLLGGERLRALRGRLRRHYERVDRGQGGALLALSSLTDDEREALALLMGRKAGLARSMRVDIDVIDQGLRDAGLAGSLRVALERIDGPIVSPRLERERRDARWVELLSRMPAAPALVRWLRSLDGARLIRRLCRQDPDVGALRLAQADAVLGRLPAHGMPRSQLAAQVLGDAHALDRGQPVATIVLAVLRAEPPSALESDRDAWASAGVLVNELARPALVLNLPLDEPHTASGMPPGEPAYLSLRQLLRRPPAWRVGGVIVHVCENPNVVAIAADRLGAGCAPLVCTDGMPAAAQRALLTQLAQAGARLRYHGDFDWPGVRIGNVVMRAWDAQPWRFGAQDYLKAIEGRNDLDEHRLRGAEVPAAWDAALSTRMRDRGWAVAEEAVVDALLEDLAGR